MFVLFAIGLFVFAGYSFGRSAGYEDGARAGEIDAPSEPSPVKAVVLVVLGGVSLASGMLLSSGGAVRVPTPARLEELVGRAEAVALSKAEEAAQSSETKTEEPATP